MGNGQKVIAAADAADLWLALVDAGRFGEAWDAGAAYLRGAVGRDAFIASLAGVRAPLGDVEARQQTGATYATELPGAPDGEYVVLEMTTRFTKKAKAVETVTPMLDPDGSWRVSGYFIA